MPSVRLPNGATKTLREGAPVADALGELEPALGARIVAAQVNAQLVDLSWRLSGESQATVLTEDDPEALEVLRHSAAHVMAEAVTRLFPETKLAIGPPIENGFYYDFDVSRSFTPEDLEKIEAEMAAIARDDKPFERWEVDRREAIRLMRDAKQNYKVEILEAIGADLPPTEVAEGDKVSFYRQGKFNDLCRGPHLPRTSRLRTFKLLRTTGAYWRGDERNPMLQRIYGTAFFRQVDLDKYLKNIEEAKKRDHRVLGKELDLFSVHEEIGSGLVHWHPKGAMVRHLIENFWRERHLREGYQLVFTPHIASERVYRTSGHLEAYSELMYSSMDIDGQPFRVKPMNCPGHIMIYRTGVRSYRELPIRFAELGTVYRYERSGVVHGLLRVRGFTIDDAHIFCRPEQVEEEVSRTFDLSLDFLKTFGFEAFEVYLATRPEKYVGTPADWDRATQALKSALMVALSRSDVRAHFAPGTELQYVVDEGGGAFYGPKIDIKVKDALGRSWQCSTIQFDFNLPERFDLKYIAEDGRPARPYMIHRALLGSLERFFGVLIEHYAGAFPLWLAPVQIQVIPVTDEQSEYAKGVSAWFKDQGLRVEADLSNERLSYKIRRATSEKVPYMLVVGEREEKSGSVAVRHRTAGDQGAASKEAFLEKIASERFERREGLFREVN